jgi:hypothetical protein
VAPTLERSALAVFAPSTESEERGLIFGPTGLEEVFAFPLHIQAAQRWFQTQGLSGPHRFSPV